MAIKRRSKNTRVLGLWSQAVCAEYYNILAPMFSHFLGNKPRPWPYGNTPGQPLVYLISLRAWTRRWAKELGLTPAKIKRYLRGQEEYIKPVLFLLSDKEAGENE